MPVMSTTANDRAAALRKPLDRLRAGLPASWYFDDAQYVRELEVFWYDRWIAAGREEDIAQPGAWRVVHIGTQSIVVLRNERGELRAFHNTCRHRGSILCTSDEGRFDRARIACPYHAWTYDLDGRLIATPRRMETPDFDMSAFSLFEVAVDAWGKETCVPVRKDLLIQVDVPAKRIVVRDVPGLTAPEDDPSTAPGR